MFVVLGPLETTPHKTTPTDEAAFPSGFLPNHARFSEPRLRVRRFLNRYILLCFAGALLTLHVDSLSSWSILTVNFLEKRAICNISRRPNEIPDVQLLVIMFSYGMMAKQF